MSRILALVPTIPPRRRSVTRLLAELAQQSRPPDGVLLCLDGYGEAPAPPCPLPVVQLRTPALSGPGAKWRVVRELRQTGPDPPLDIDCLAPDDILVCVDDDAMLCEAPHFLRELVAVLLQPSRAAIAEEARKVAAHYKR